MSTHRVPRPGFAEDARKGDQKSFETRVQIAKVRILCSIEKHDGSINIRSEGDAVNFCLRYVHNRGRELGCHRNGEFKKVLAAALRELVKDESVVHEEFMLRLNYTPRPRRQHKQKYPSSRGFRPRARTA